MKNLIKTFLKKITYLIVSIIQKFKVGVYFLELLNINISNIILKSPEKKTNLKFYCPNRVNKFRIESFFTKEPETLDWLNSFKNNSVFFDIGANIGLYSCYAADQRNCKVIAFEPSVFNLDLLSKNVFLNSLSKNVTIVPIPMSNETKVAEFNMSNTTPGGAISTFGENYIHDGSEMNKVFKYNIPGTTIDNAISFFKLPEPDYIKIDVDGIEHLILEGITNTFQNVKSILVEVNDKFEKQNKNVKKILEDNGFVMKLKLQSDIVASSPNTKVTTIYNQIWEKR